MYQLFIFTKFGTVLKFEFPSVKGAFDHGQLYPSATERKITRGQYIHRF